MSEPVYVVGAARTDFRRNLRKEGKTIRHLIVEAGTAAIADAGLAPGAVEAAVVGNFASGLFTRQLHLGAFVTEIDSALRGIPTVHVEAACASGGVAVLTGAQQIMGGLRDVVLVIGAEQQKTMPPVEGADVLGAAADYHEERARHGDFMFPKLFARIADAYVERHGLSETSLAMVAVKNHGHARLNPLAQMRDTELTFAQASVASEANPVIAPPLKVSDCSQITDGSAALILCSHRFLDKLRPPHAARLLGYGHTTDYLPLERKEMPDFPIAASAATQAYRMAAVRPDDIHGAEVHDCFSISEIVQYELLRFAEPGQGVDLLESGATALPAGRCPVNAGGGLLGDGHPVGATGVRQVVEAFQQLTSQAGLRQIPGARRFLTCNIGGSLTTTVVMIWEQMR
ncbi:MAG: acetyl-CoA C-acetyltransferase [Chthoniobacter sp.]|jgi:acetyl-CoA C-acetyltransferase|nr:acetyl-CoA C-acetyltransferase [Chthoniobacter sp.]